MLTPLLLLSLASGATTTSGDEACAKLAERLGCRAPLAAAGGPSAGGLTVADTCPSACPSPSNASTAGATAAAAAPTALTFSMADISDWHFAGGGKESAPPQTGAFGAWLEENKTGWLRPISMATPEDGMLAIHTKTAFTTFNVSFDFIVGQGPKAECWSPPAFVFAAKDAQHFKTLEFPYQGQQNRAEHFWAQVNRVSDSSGWRESLSMQGPVHGVTSGNSWPHTVRATLGNDGLLFVWVDGRPLEPVQVGTAAGYLGLATYNILGNDVARFKNVQVVGQAAAASFDMSVGMGRGFTVIPGTDPIGAWVNGAWRTTSKYTGDSRHVGHMVRAPNGDYIAPNGGSQLRTKDGKAWTLDPRPSGTGQGGHMMKTTENGKPALASFHLKGPTPPCPDCGAPIGSVWKLTRSVSLTSGFSWDNGTTVQEVLPPPVSCTPSAVGLKPPVDCKKLTWRMDEGIHSILTLRDGTVLLFGVAHNGDLGEMTANQRVYYFNYQKKGGDGTGSPIPGLGFSFALRSTDSGHSFGQMINLDGPWTEQSSMFVRERQLSILCLSLRFHGARWCFLYLFRSLTKRCCERSLRASRCKGSRSHRSRPRKGIS